MAKTFGIKDEVHTFKHKFIVSSGAVGTIAEGIPTKAGTVTVGNVVPMVDGDGTTSQQFTGISATLSTDTAAAAGEVYTWEPFSDVLYVGAAKSATAANSQAKVDALQYKRVVFDLTGSDWTVDSAAADATTNNVIIVGGDYLSNLLFFVVKGSYLYA